MNVFSKWFRMYVINVYNSYVYSSLLSNVENVYIFYVW